MAVLTPPFNIVAPTPFLTQHMGLGGHVPYGPLLRPAPASSSYTSFFKHYSNTINKYIWICLIEFTSSKYKCRILRTSTLFVLRKFILYSPVLSVYSVTALTRVLLREPIVWVVVARPQLHEYNWGHFISSDISARLWILISRALPYIVELYITSQAL